MTNQKKYQIMWQQLVDMQATVFADSEQEAIEMILCGNYENEQEMNCDLQEESIDCQEE